MPLLDTSTWFIMIVSTSRTLFIIMQLKIPSHYYYSTPEPKMTKTIKPPTPWEVKGTKMYSPLLLPQR